MSHRDYANRRPQTGAKPRPVRATRPSRAKPSQSKAARRTRLPLTLIAFAILAVGGFIYFLWSIKNNAPQEEKQQPAVVKKAQIKVKPQETTLLTPKVKEPARQVVVIPEETAEPVPVAEPVVVPLKKDPNALPPQPKEEWTYLKELENKHVEVDIPDVVASRTPVLYQLQCASFRQESQANEMKAVIAFQGLEAQVRQIEGTTGIWYKVALGPYERKRDAERKRHTLQKAGINGCQILPVPK
ncbi:SPOR domain-containing protein [Shewanella glacialipiscicola]|uniref:SPOR domain-containing protein n=1 Tax=Shewanella glacialipiscicola TaxID=614069 RepID=UPI0021D9E1DD|nr:SPOR domain-containing protein [Shewanella glacialipiscicola]MCU7994163.1 SPOR domain-containing protein [Shewanella glacialipiscicola]MCU8025481.1 SPOR domain-containing protein [Shewanella glacialipiscicola]